MWPDIINRIIVSGRFKVAPSKNGNILPEDIGKLDNYSILEKDIILGL